MAKDVFPQTMRTWIERKLDLDDPGRLELNAHLMRTYALPLRVYYLGTNLRWLGEPEDVVDGFFADRLGRPDFLDQWRASGMRLRRWLMNGLCYYLMELRRLRYAERAMSEPAAEPFTFSGDPDAAVDRAAVVAFVQQAMLDAEARCDANGLEAHWRVFIRHNVDGIPLADLGAEFEVDAARAAVMARTAKRKFRAALGDVLIRDGVSPDRVDDEIRSLLEVSA
jgi:hypothetical protein